MKEIEEKAMPANFNLAEGYPKGVNSSELHLTNYNENPLVSVVIPTFQRVSTLKRSIDSVLKQTYRNIEIIVVDDNNDDEFHKETVTLIEETYIGFPVKLFFAGQNQGRSAARNEGLRICNGEYVMFLDNDDEFTSTKIESQLSVLIKAGSNFAACYSNYVRVKNERIVVRCGERRSGQLLVESIARDLFVHAGSNLLVKKAVALGVGGFAENLEINEDIDFLNRILIDHKLVYCDHVGLIVHVHDRSDIDMEVATAKYQQAVGAYKGLLSTDEQRIVDKMHALQLTRYYALTKRNTRVAWGIVKKEKLGFLLLLQYSFYLFKRAVVKRSFGFLR